MRIAVVTPSFPTRAEPYRGAPVWATLRELSLLAELEVSCTNPRYLLPMERHRDFFHGAPSLERFPEIRARTVEFPAVPLLSRSLNALSIAGGIRPWLRRLCPDAVLAYWVYPDGLAAARVGRELGIPSVVVSLGSDLKRIPPDPFLRRLTRSALREATRVIAVSRDLADAAGRLSPGARVRVVSNGVDLENFRMEDAASARRALRVDPSEKLVLFAGRLVPLKRAGSLVEALALLAGEDARWSLALAGNGSQEQELRRRVSALGLQAHVRFLGPRPPAEVARWMNAADALCLPSESEGQPNVIVEALSVGCPVVATAVGGVPEIVTAQTGILVPDADPRTLAGALAEACSRSWDRGAISRRHRRGWRQAANETLAICAEAVEEVRPVRPRGQGWG